MMITIIDRSSTDSRQEDILILEGRSSMALALVEAARSAKRCSVHVDVQVQPLGLNLAIQSKQLLSHVAHSTCIHLAKPGWEKIPKHLPCIASILP